MTHIAEATLHDYLDGTADAAARAVVDGHLAACERCRAELAALRRLGRELEALPREIPPSHDLRAGIHARIAAGREDHRAGDGAESPVLPLRARNTGRSVRGTRILASAAAVLLVAATAAITRLVVLRTAGAPPVPSAARTGEPASPASPGPARAGSGATLASLRADEDRYVAAIAEMQRALDHDRTKLSPETVRILERNLAVIDRAIAESRAALARDPGDPELGRMILSAYGQKLELLRRAREASS